MHVAALADSVGGSVVSCPVGAVSGIAFVATDSPWDPTAKASVPIAGDTAWVPIASDQTSAKVVVLPATVLEFQVDPDQRSCVLDRIAIGASLRGRLLRFDGSALGPVLICGCGGCDYASEDGRFAIEPSVRGTCMLDIYCSAAVPLASVAVRGGTEDGAEVLAHVDDGVPDCERDLARFEEDPIYCVQRLTDLERKITEAQAMRGDVESMPAFDFLLDALRAEKHDVEAACVAGAVGALADAPPSG